MDTFLRLQPGADLALRLHELHAIRDATRDNTLASLIGDSSETLTPSTWHQRLLKLGLHSSREEADHFFQLADPHRIGALSVYELQGVVSQIIAPISKSLHQSRFIDPLEHLARRALFLALPTEALSLAEATNAASPRASHRSTVHSRLPSKRVVVGDKVARSLQAALEVSVGVRIGAGATLAQLTASSAPGVPTPLQPDLRPDENAPPLGVSRLLRAGLILEMRPRETAGSRWPGRLAYYSGLTSHGVLVLAGSLDEASRWVRSAARQREVAELAAGRLYVLIAGHVCALSPAEPCATAAEGFGHVLNADGCTYVGGLQDGLYHGRGKLILADGCTTYEGDFRRGQKHGRGRTTFADGIVFVGEYVEGRRHGPGRLYAPTTKPSAPPAPTSETHLSLVMDGFWDGELGFCHG